MCGIAGIYGTDPNKIISLNKMLSKLHHRGPDENGIYQQNNSSSWSTSSDRRIKKNIIENTTGLDAINKLEVKSFEYRTKEEIIADAPELEEVVDAAVVDKDGVQVGVIAQEIQEVLPDVVKVMSTGVKTVNPDNITWYLVNAVKELSAKVTALEAA